MTDNLKLDNLSKYFNLARLKKIDPKVYTTAARILKEKRRYDDAISVLEEGLQNFPENFIVAFILGKTLFYEGRIDLAAQALEKAVTLDPTDQKALKLLERAQLKPAGESPLIDEHNQSPRPENYIGIAKKLRFAKRESESVELLREGNRNFPKDFLIIFQLGKSLYFLSRFKEAESALEAAKTIRPDDKNARSYLACAANATKQTSGQDGTFKAPFLGR